MSSSYRFLVVGAIVAAAFFAQLLLPTDAFAQREYDVWELGYGTGLDFRGGGVPTTRTGNQMQQLEGHATIGSRTTGAMLFYTDGQTVWDRRHRAMPNGTGLISNYSTVQAALIVPMPCDTNQFYVFTADQQGYFGPPRGQFWSLVDMRLNGGYGDVVSKNTALSMTGVWGAVKGSERLTAVAHANGRDYWVVTHSIGGAEFYAYQVSGAGVSTTPVVTSAGFNQGRWNSAFGEYALGMLKASPDGRHLVMINHNLATVELFDFNASTGSVSNAISVYISNVGRGDLVYGTTFSPDGTKLYHTLARTIAQYNLVPYRAASIVASQTMLRSPTGPFGWGSLGAMQVAPDNKIYIAADSGWIGIIQNPNTMGAGAGYNERFRDMGDSLFLGLPNNIDARISLMASGSVRIDTSGPLTFCDPGSVNLTAQGGFTSYRWSTGATGRTITVTRSGIYTVTVTDTLGCIFSAGVQVLVIDRPHPEITGPVEFCEGDSAVLNVTQPFTRYSWSTGDTTRSIVVRSGGTYTVTVTNEYGCVGDTDYTVKMNPRPTPVIAGDLDFCEGDSTLLDAGAGYTSYLWSSGDTTQTIMVKSAGIWRVTVTNQFGCSDESPAVVTVVNPLPEATILADRLKLCEGDAATLTGPNGVATYSWSTGATSRSIQVATAGRYTLIVANEFGCLDTAWVDIIVNPLPIPTIVGPTEFCDGDSVVLDAGRGYISYLWSSGEATRTIVVKSAGTWSVQVTDTNGCIGISDGVDVFVNPLPDAEIVGAASICPDVASSYSVTPTPGASYLWFIEGNGAITAGQGTSMITIGWGRPGTGRLMVIVTSKSGCISRDTFDVTINPELLPKITPNRDPKLCEGDSVTLDAGAGYANYNWSSGEKSRRITVRNAGNYVVWVTDSNGCTGVSDPLKVSVVLNPLPIIKLLGSAEICEGDSVVLDAGAGYANYLWSNGDTTRTIVIKTSGSFSVGVIDTNGCRGGSPSVAVNVTPYPRPDIDGPRLVCRGSVVEYRTLDVAGNSYRWRVTGGSILSGQGSASILVRWGNGGSGTIDLTETNAAGCATDAETATVIVGDVLEPMITALGPLRFCDGDSVVLDAGDGFNNYQWSTGETTRRIVVRRSGSYTVRVSDNSGCAGSSAAIDVLVNTNPVAAIAGHLYQACFGERITLSGPEGYTSYRWSTGEETRQIEVDRSGVYTVRVTDLNGCSSLSSGDTVLIHSPATKPSVSTLGEILTSTPAAAYQWRTAGQNIALANARDYKVPSPGSYTVLITDSNGCIAESDPVDVTSGHIVYLDTVSAHVGQPVFLTMRIHPALTATDAISGYSIKLRLARKALNPIAVVSADVAVTGESARMHADRKGEITIERPASAATIVGDQLMLLTVEGLSQGLVENIVTIESIKLLQSSDPGRQVVQLFYDTVSIAGHGLVILSGCDITHGFGVGKRGVLRYIRPNPVRTAEMTITYRLPLSAQGAQILMNDVAGRHVRGFELGTGTGEDQNLVVDVKGLVSGVYMVELRHGAQRSVLPVVIIK